VYIPKPFQVEDPAIIWDFIRAYPFATLVSTLAEGEPLISHIPVIEDPVSSTLVGHLAGANPHAGLVGAKRESVLVFHGPDAYISPTWYKAREAVPTWAYAAVHAFGCLVPVSAERKRKIVELTTSHFESGRPTPWSDQPDERSMEKMLGAIVAFEMKPTRLEAKFKLGQNRSLEDRRGVMAGLLEEDAPSSREMAAFIDKHARP